MSLKKIIASVMATGIAATMTAQELYAEGDIFTIGNHKVTYHTDRISTILAVQYESGTREIYLDLSNDSIVDAITITDFSGATVSYHRINPRQQPFVKLGQVVFDSYMAEIAKKKKVNQ